MGGYSCVDKVFPTDAGCDDEDEEDCYPREVRIPSYVRERLRLCLTRVTRTGSNTHRFTALRPENDICPIKELVTRGDIKVTFTNEKRDRRDKHDSDPSYGP